MDTRRDLQELQDNDDQAPGTSDEELCTDCGISPAEIGDPGDTRRLCGNCVREQRYRRLRQD